MGQQPVKADRDPEGRDRVHPGQDPDIAEIDGAVPQQRDRGQDAGDRDDDTGEVGDPFGSSHGPSLPCLSAYFLRDAVSARAQK